MVVERIFISPEHGSDQVECDQVIVQAGKGVVGDRNFVEITYRGQNITLVEAEEIELFCAEYSHSPDLSITRRNLVTRGVRLNDLVNVEFTIGNVRLRGVELCEPCSLLGDRLSHESLAPSDVVKYWVSRGGLMADVLSGGEIVRGALIETNAS